MGFGKDMKGKASHEAIVRIQDAELRLLDTLHHFITVRIDNDKKYVTGLGKMLNVNKSDSSEFKECCNIFKTWEVILQETENVMKLMKSNTDHLQSNTLDILSQLISEKKQAKKRYLDERNRLESDFTKVQDEVSKNRIEYFKSVERLNTDKARFLDSQSKGRPGPKVDELKSKFFRSAVQLHKQHNDYVISLNNAQEHQTMMRDTAIPAVLDFHQDGQEAFVHKIKFVLEDYLKHTDMCNVDFQSSTEKVRRAIHAIQPGKEYSGSFIDFYKSTLSPPMEFTFDEKLLDNYSGSLRSSSIELNDLTEEALNEKLARLTKDMKEIKEKIFCLNSEQQIMSVEVNSLSASLGEGCSIENLNNYLARRSQAENLTREILEFEGNLKKLEKLVTLIQQPLDQIGSGQAPLASDIHNIAEPGSNSLSNPPPLPSKDATFGRSLANMMSPLKKITNIGTRNLSASSEDGSTDDRPTRKKGAQGYENRPDQFRFPPNGSNPPISMRAMKEQGHLVDMDASEAKDRIADEKWFHGILPREEVQRLLICDGDFLVRESKNRKTSETQFVLSVFWQGPRHFIIQFSEDRGWHMEGEAYPTIQEMVLRFYESQKPITGKSGAILKTPIEREWELLNDDIELKVKIGSGNFGDVFKGLYKKTQEVAVKTCKETLTEDQKIKFLQEGRILKQYKHPNIVRYIGIAAQKQPVMIVMEFISKGSLQSFLKLQGNSQSSRQKVQMCVDAASGMEYLESRGCIHRDLAARNCLVGENNIIKISDFGMSREEQVYTVVSGNSQVPIKWTAPEALNFAQYTSLCDVWSFGVLMWEVFSCGKTPYPGMSNARAREWVEEGHRLEAPTSTPDAVYNLMLKCWEYRPENRPHFSSVRKTLQDIAKRV